MEISILVFSILSTVIALVALIFVVDQAIKNKKQNKTEDFAPYFDALSEKLQKSVRELGQEQQKSFIELSKLTTEQLRVSLTSHSSEVDKSVDKVVALLNSNIKNVIAIQERSITAVEGRLEKLSEQIKENLSGIREDNTKQLEKMREVVDEKLHKSLEERLQLSFSMITDKLEKVKEGFVEMQNLSKGVTDLNKVLNGVKTRGTWGETSLQSLVEDVLAPEQYLRNVTIKPNKIVEFCIKLPGVDENVLLPVDCKFPLADYEKVVEYSLDGKVEEMNSARKNLYTLIKNEAKDIHEYIIPPKTTDFAIMYLPIEGLYAEIAKNSELVEGVRKKYNVVIAGPSTFAALLNSLQVGFRTLALQKNSLEIQKVLVSFKAEFVKFAELLEKSEQQATKLSETLQGVIKRTDKIDRKLKVIDLPDGSSDANGTVTIIGSDED